jgi:hypothetical protein
MFCSPPATSSPNRPCALGPNALTSRSPLHPNIPTFEPSNLQTTNLDAASSISPLFATLTENTRGWVSAIVNFFAAETESNPAKPGVCSLLRQSTSERSEAKDPQESKYLAFRPIASDESPVTASALFLQPATSRQSQITKSCRIRTSAKRARNSRRIRTSKTQDLKPFRMNTYRKTGEGGGDPVRPLSQLVIPSAPRDLLFHCQAPTRFLLLTAHYSLLTSTSPGNRTQERIVAGGGHEK